MKKTALTLIFLASLLGTHSVKFKLTAVHAQAASKNTNEAISSAQQEKLDLEIAELKRREHIPFFLNQPIFLTIITLLLGGYFFNRINERKARRDKQLEKTVEFIDEVGKDLNAALTVMFRYIRLGNYEDNISYEEEQLGERRKELLSELEQKVPTLFAKRMSVQVKSEALLKDMQFSKAYVDLIREVGKIFEIVREFKDSDEPEAYLVKIDENKTRLANEWPLTDKFSDRKLRQPFKELNCWTEMVWSRTVSLLSSTLKRFLR